MKCELSRYLSSKLNENELKQYGLEYLAKNESYAGYFFDQFTIPVLLNLQNAADKADIPVLFFKGAIEKYDTYKSLHLNRDQRDVDILVSYDDVFRLCQICKDLGFAPEGGEINENWVESSLSNLARHHLPVIHKKIINNASFISMEVHIVLTPMWNTLSDRSEYVRSILKNRCILNEIGLYGMSVIDRLIFSFLHFTNDFFPNAATFYYCPENRLLNCKSLSDAYLLLVKYYNLLDVEQIVQRIHFFGLEYNALFSINIMRYVFNVCPFDEMLTYITHCCLPVIQDDNVSFDKKVLYGAYLASREMVKYDSIAFYKKIVSQCLSMNKTLHAPKNQKTEFRLQGKEIVSSYFSWDDRAMTIQIEILKKDLLCWKNTANAYDGINLRIYNPNYDVNKDNAVRNIFVCFKDDEKGTVDITFNGADPTLRGTMPASGIKAELCRTGSEHLVNITIPWMVQEMIPSAPAYIGFECTLSLYEEDKHNLLYWSNGTAPHYNPTKFGRILLING